MLIFYTYFVLLQFNSRIYFVLLQFNSTIQNSLHNSTPLCFLPHALARLFYMHAIAIILVNEGKYTWALNHGHCFFHTFLIHVCTNNSCSFWCKHSAYCSPDSTPCTYTFIFQGLNQLSVMTSWWKEPLT